jgi:hypothetical protein
MPKNSDAEELSTAEQLAFGVTEHNLSTKGFDLP